MQYRNHLKVLGRWFKISKTPCKWFEILNAQCKWWILKAVTQIKWYSHGLWPNTSQVQRRLDKTYMVFWNWCLVKTIGDLSYFTLLQHSSPPPILTSVQYNYMQWICKNKAKHLSPKQCRLRWIILHGTLLGLLSKKKRWIFSHVQM